MKKVHSFWFDRYRWVVWADGAEQERLRAYHQRAIGDEFRHRWTEPPLAEQP